MNLWYFNSVNLWYFNSVNAFYFNSVTLWYFQIIIILLYVIVYFRKHSRLIDIFPPLVPENALLFSESLSPPPSAQINIRILKNEFWRLIQELQTIKQQIFPALHLNGPNNYPLSPSLDHLPPELMFRQKKWQM